MSASHEISQHLPFLRRYARALTGSQRSGDAFVQATLQALLADRSALSAAVPLRVALYKLFHSIWVSAQDFDDLPDPGSYAGTAAERLRALTPLRRQGLLLTTIEGFSTEEAAKILGVDREEAARLIAEARQEIDHQTKSRLLIIEDEVLIAVDLSDIVSGLGHTVVATVDTAAKAVAAAREHRPDLILADIQLADGSSGIEAVEHILTSFRVPVIFITAYPDRLLTGNRPEPAFLIAKPYVENTVQAAVSQALFFQSTLHS
jgi:CheY-like chemotaxis protein